MNKDEKLYLEKVFIPNMEKIGYKLFQKNEELYKFCYKEQVFFNLFLQLSARNPSATLPSPQKRLQPQLGLQPHITDISELLYILI